jgi:hypothetical protein
MPQSSDVRTLLIFLAIVFVVSIVVDQLRVPDPVAVAAWEAEKATRQAEQVAHEAEARRLATAAKASSDQLHPWRRCMERADQIGRARGRRIADGLPVGIEVDALPIPDPCEVVKYAFRHEIQRATERAIEESTATWGEWAEMRLRRMREGLMSDNREWMDSRFAEE